MITVKQLKKAIAELPDNWVLWAYEGEDIGISFEEPGHENDTPPDDKFAFLHACQDDAEDGPCEKCKEAKLEFSLNDDGPNT